MCRFLLEAAHYFVFGLLSGKILCAFTAVARVQRYAMGGVVAKRIKSSFNKI